MLKEVLRSPYTFRYDIKKISADEYIFTLYGKHLANNRINALNRGELFRYRAAIKRAISNYFILNTKIVPEQCFLKAEMFAVAYNPRSRDSDANTINLKILIDVFESRGFILNDSRKILIEHKCDEVISKEYKIEIRLMNTTPKEQ